MDIFDITDDFSLLMADAESISLLSAEVTCSVDIASPEFCKAYIINTMAEHQISIIERLLE